MGWFRANKGWGGRLALSALVLQLTLSFAHIHADDGPAAPAQASVTLHQDGDGDHHGQSGRGDCAICAAVHIAASLVLAPPPAIVLPVKATPAWRSSAERISASARFHTPQARAPPQA